MNKKTKASLNMRITSEVSKLAKDSAAQIENLRLSSKKARSEMRRELLYAVRKSVHSATAQLKTNFKRELAQQVDKLNKKTAELKKHDDWAYSFWKKKLSGMQNGLSKRLRQQQEEISKLNIKLVGGCASSKLGGAKYAWHCKRHKTKDACLFGQCHRKVRGSCCAWTPP